MRLMLNKVRVTRLAEIMSGEDVDAMLIGPSADLEYMAGYSPLPDERFKGLVVLSDGESFYISPSLYFEETRNKIGAEIKIYVWDDKSGFLGAIESANRDFKLDKKRIAVNEGIKAVDLIDIQTVIKSDFVKGNNILEKLRIIKDEDEIKNLKYASKIADEVMNEIIKFIRPGMKERDVKDKIKELCFKKGAGGLSFEPIVASGPNSSMPHYCGEDRFIGEKDIVVLDFGCRYNGYCSDITRTVFVGEVSEEEKRIYDIVAAANLEGELAVKAGISAEEVDRKTRSVIEKAGYGEYFIHRTGHGIGVSVHEAPYIKEGNKQILQKGMVFSVEPGIYLQDRFGIRIEDLVLVKDDGVEILNAFPKEMVVI